jgi:hypothetical protein
MEAYRKMLFYYGIKTLMNYLEEKFQTGKAAGKALSFEQCIAELQNADNETEGRVREWVNMGGQIVPAFRIDALRAGIRDGKLQSWDAIHGSYDEMAAAYPADRARHAWAVLNMVYGKIDKNTFKTALDGAVKTAEWIKEQVFLSRAKDFHDPFRSITYRNQKEMDQVAGKVENNSFVKLAEENYLRFKKSAQAIRESI